MRYITDTTEFQIEEPTIVTLGKFDGRHRGHQKLLRTMMELKQELGIPRPSSPLARPGNSSHGQPQTVITTNLERRANMERMGIDYLVEYPFDEETAIWSPEAFVKDILAGRMHAREIVVGPDCSFGYKGGRQRRTALCHGPRPGIPSPCHRKGKGPQARHQQHLYP